MDIFPSDNVIIAVMIVLCIINLNTKILPLELLSILAVIIGIRHIDTISGIITMTAGSFSLLVSLGYGIAILISWVKERK